MNNSVKYDLFGKKKYRVGEIIVRIPTISLICGDSEGNNENAENKFWQEVGMFITSPADMMSELDDMGVDFEKLSNYDLFLIRHAILKASGLKSCMLFEQFNLFDLNLINDVLVDSAGKTIINRQNYAEISALICAILGHKMTEMPRFGNKYAKKKKIEFDRERKKRARERKDNTASVLSSLKLRLVCSGKTPYSYDTIGNLTIYELLWSIKQIDKEKSVDELKQTALVGNDLTKIASERLSPYAL